MIEFVQRFFSRASLWIAICPILALSLVFVAAVGDAGAARRALLVGIEDYPDPRLNLKGVREDLKLLHRALVSRGVFGADDIMVLSDKDATKENVVAAFRDWLIRGTRPGDTALFYFSGHGVQVWDENGDEIQDGMDEALIAYDSKVVGDRVRRSFRGRPGYAYALDRAGDLVLDDELNLLLKELTGRTVVFLSDSCHAGSVYKNLDGALVTNKTPALPFMTKSVFSPRTSRRGWSPQPRESTNIGKDLIPDDVQVAAFTASEDTQPAQVAVFQQFPKGFHSVFTWHLYHALNGRADLDRDGSIALGELSDYLRNEIKRSGFSQIPQTHFSPKALRRLALVSGKTEKDATVEGRDAIGCLLDARGPISAELTARFKTAVERLFPLIRWRDEKSRTACRIVLEQRGDRVGARLSDATGALWEAHEGGSIDEIIPGIAGNLIAHYIQTDLNLLRNVASDADLRVSLRVDGDAPRAEGEAVEGDRLIFEVGTSTGGYVYLFNVDTMGVIHPLYPDPGKPPERLGKNDKMTLGEALPFVAGPPFGKEMLFAFLLPESAPELGRLWNRDDIGDPDKPGAEAQIRFLNTLRSALTRDGRPAGRWASHSTFIESFKE